MYLYALGLADATAHEKSKTAFYIAAGVLAAWAVGVSFLSFSQPDFARPLQQARVAMGISAVLVTATIAAAVLTGSTPEPTKPYAKNIGATKGTAPPLTPPSVTP